MAGSLSGRSASRGRILLTGPNPDDRVRIEANALSHPDDLAGAKVRVELMREIGSAPALQPHIKREVMPGNLSGAELEDYLRDAASTYWHHVGTAKMGNDTLSVVDSSLKVFGLDGLRIADASIMPRITTANTMAPAWSSGNEQQNCSPARTANDGTGFIDQRRVQVTSFWLRDKLIKWRPFCASLHSHYARLPLVRACRHANGDK